MGRINQNWLERRKQKPAATPTQGEQPTHALLESQTVAEQQKVVSDETPANAPLKSSAGTEAQNVVFDEKPADALLKSVNDTAGNARNLFVTYILLSVYIFLTVGATNDEQLLRDDSVAVPFLENINLPVSRFYQFVPWMFLFVHADLLLLFKLMADKLHAFNETINKPEFDRKEAAELRQQLSGLPFVHWLAGDQNDGFSHRITGLIVWSSLLVLPLLTLLALQIGFLPYHSTLTTFAHQVALGLDALALLWFWPRLAAGMTEWTLLWWLPFRFIRLGKIMIASRFIQSVLHSKKAVNQWIASMARKVRHERNQVLNAHSEPVENQQQSFLKYIEHPTACRGVCRTASLLLLVGSVWFGGFVLVLPRERLEDNGLLVRLLLDDESSWQEDLSEDYKPRPVFESDFLDSFPIPFDNLTVSNPNEDESRNLISWIIKHKISLENTINAFLTNGFKHWVYPHLPVFPRNLDLHEKVLVKNELEPAALAELLDPTLKLHERPAMLAKIKGLDLKNRDLRFANLSEAKLWRADLRGANLQHANLSKAQLQGIQWDVRVRLQAAVLKSAGLQGADLQSVHLQGADLSHARLQGANLQSAKLQGTVLEGANLEGADLSFANLIFAIMLKVHLQMSNLNSSDLRGAVLMNADLTGAYISGYSVRLKGAIMGGAHVGSTTFPNTLSLNAFTGLDTSKPLTQQDFDFWKAEIRGFLKDEQEAKKRETWLQSRIGKATEWPSENIGTPCLSDVNHSTPFQNCHSSEPEFFMAWGEYIGKLACDDREAGEQDFIAKRLALLLSRDANAREHQFLDQVVPRLLQDDCAGKAGLDDDLRANLRKIAEAPEAK